MEALTTELAAPETARNREGLRALKAEYKDLETRLRELYEEWERVSQELTTARE
jgi:hypothetical protein